MNVQALKVYLWFEEMQLNFGTLRFLCLSYLIFPL